MAKDRQFNELVGTWLHSHEEDTRTEQIYRRSDFAFPPSRGRTGFDFRLDGTCTYIGIAARDGSTKEECQWQLSREGAQTEIVLTFPNGQRRALPLLSVDQDRLAIEKT